MTPEIVLATDVAGLFRIAADEFVRQAGAAVKAKGSFAVALSGGSTPKGLYSLLVDDPGLRAQIPWKQTYFFWSDERHVAPDHADSNYGMARDALLSKLPIGEGQVFRMRGELPDSREVARQYEDQLRQYFRLTPGQLPRFDLALLGLGPDGHTASLFPGTTALEEQQAMVVSNWVGKFYTDRITMTAPILNSAALVMFLVQGADKAPALKAVLEGPHEPRQLPAQLIQPTAGRLVWLLEPQAARMLAPRG